MELVTGAASERSYQNLRKLVKWFLELDAMKENDKAMLGGTKAPGYAMALLEDSHAKPQNGNCRTFFNTGRCGKPGCSWNHDSCLPKNLRTTGKSKGKGGKPSTTGKPSGGGRDNSPPKPKK